MGLTRWKPIPDQYPATCIVTRGESSQDGPYLEGPTYRVRSPHGEREATLYLSAFALREALADPDSPFMAVPKDEYEAVLADHHALKERVAELEQELAAVRADRDHWREANLREQESQTTLRTVIREVLEEKAPEPDPAPPKRARRKAA